MPSVSFDTSLELYKFPHTPSKLHDRVLKLIVILISFIPLMAFVIAFTVRTQGFSQQICVFKHGSNGAIPCFAVAQLDFEKKTRPLDLLLGPLIEYAVEWQVTCLERPIIKEEYELVHRSSLDGLQHASPDKQNLEIYNYKSYEYNDIQIETGTNCFYQTVYSIKNLVFVEFMEFGLLLGVAIYYSFHFFLPGHTLPFIYSLLTFVVNLEVLGLALSMLIQLIITLVMSVYVKILNKMQGVKSVVGNEI